jgi:hypothetical protein
MSDSPILEDNMAILFHDQIVSTLAEFCVNRADAIEGWPLEMVELRTRLTDLILESPYGITVDWRGELAELLEPLADGIAGECGVEIEVNFIDEDSANVTVIVDDNARQITLQYRPNEDDLRDSARLLQQASAGHCEFHELRESADSDTYCWAILSPERWARVRSHLGESFGEVFCNS